MIMWIIKASSYIYIKALVYRSKQQGFDPVRAKSFLDKEMILLPQHLESYLSFHSTEVDIAEVHLNRRYDLGAVLNDAGNRALKDKKIQNILTEGQIRALEFQKAYLDQVVKNS